MKILFFTFLISTSICSCRKTLSDNSEQFKIPQEIHDPNTREIPIKIFPFSIYDSVVAYSFNKRWSGEDNQIITQYKPGLNSTAELPGIRLSEDQAIRILQIINDTSTYSG